MVDSARKEQGTVIEWLLAWLMARYNFLVEHHQSNRDKSDIQQAAMAILPDNDRYQGSSIVQPDFSCSKRTHGYLIEVKSKHATRNNTYGLDWKRFNGLVTYQNHTVYEVLYVIYDMDLAGGRLDDENAFVYASVNDLNKTKEAGGNYYFWPTSAFKPLIPFLEAHERAAHQDASLPEGVIAPSIIPPHHGAGGTATMH